TGWAPPISRCWNPSCAARRGYRGRSSTLSRHGRAWHDHPRVCLPQTDLCPKRLVDGRTKSDHDDRVQESGYFFASSYLNETLTLVRKASTLPLFITRSCSTTSATRRSRS